MISLKSPGKDILDKEATIAESERLIQLAQLQDSINWLIQYVDSFVENLQCDKEVTVGAGVGTWGVSSGGVSSGISFISS